MAWWNRRGDQLRDEMLRHIEFETQVNIDAGMSAEEARYAARRKFGNISLAAEQSRELWGWLWLERLYQDVRYALRGLANSPAFTSVTLLSLMMGIGASTALFSVVYGVLIAPYPYAKPDQIWAPAVLGPKESPNGWHSYTTREFLELRKSPVIADAMATLPERVLLKGESGTESFFGVQLTGGAFNFLGVNPVIGRTIQPFDISPAGEAQPVVVLSYRFWQRVYNGNAEAIGKKLILNDVPHTVIGVMPPRFGWWTSDAFWLPMPMDVADDHSINAIFRLRPGITQEVAEQQLQQLNLRLASENPQHFPRNGFRTRLLNYMDITSASGEMSSSLHLLLAAVGLLLLIACVNVANLQLARTTTRAREIAVRLSIGATRPRLIRQLLTESVLLSLVGGALGLLFAVGATNAIVALMPSDNVPNEARITVNTYVLLFSLATSILTGILFGLAPAIRCSRPNLADHLKDGGRGSLGSIRGQATRRWLVVTEVALSFILLAGASLAIRSFAHLLFTDPGFQPERALLLEVPLPPNQYSTLEQRNLFDRNVLEAIGNLPGVQVAAIGNGVMPFGGPQSPYTIAGQSRDPDRRVMLGLISSEYPRTLGITLRRGRELAAQEVENGAHLALINESAAKLWTAGQDPIGRSLAVDVLATPPSSSVLIPPGSSPDVIVVGIVADTKNAGLRNATQPAVFVPYKLAAPPSRLLAIRTFGDPSSILNAVRQRIHALDSEVPVGRSATLKEILGFETMQPRFNMALLASFAALGLSLAAIGIYSVISYDVAQRMHELSIRVALGAKRADILILVLRKAANVTLVGVLIGVGGSFAVERIVRFKVFSESFDAFSMISVVAILFLVALVAAWWPARRAGEAKPISALRYEA
jgi:predicted permease